MYKCLSTLTLPVLLAASVNAVAADDTNEKSPWTSSVELGFIRTTGNTETQTTALKADTKYEVDKWRHSGHAEGYGQQSKDDATGETLVSAERYQVTGKSDYKFTELDYAFAKLDLQIDHFSGFEYDHVLTVGYGRKVIKQADMELDLEAGVGERFFKPDNSDSDDEAVLHLGGNFWWAISDNSKFTQELSTDIGENITSSKSVTGIQANINKTLAMKFTYTIRNKSEVPAGTEKTDTEASATLVYNF